MLCHHANVIQSFLHVVVRLYLVIVNSNCSHNYYLLHIAKTGHLRLKDPKLEQENLEILVKNVLMSRDEEHKYQEKVVVDVAIDQNVNRSRTTEDDSERVAYQVKIQEKV